MKWLVIIVVIVAVSLCVLFGIVFPNCQVPYWLAGIGTLLLAVVAVFQDWIRARIPTANLEIEFRMNPPYCKKDPYLHYKENYRKLSEYYVFRLGIQNKTLIPAKNVILRVISIKRNGNTYHFLQRSLAWSYNEVDPPHDSERMSLSIIPGKATEFCHLGRIFEPTFRKANSKNKDHLPIPYENKAEYEVLFSLALFPRQGSLDHLLEPKKGETEKKEEYEVEIIVSADNVKSEIHRLKICFSDQWSDDWYDGETGKWKNGPSIELINH